MCQTVPGYHDIGQIVYQPTSSEPLQSPTNKQIYKDEKMQQSKIAALLCYE